MTDKERILTNIIMRLYSTQLAFIREDNDSAFNDGSWGKLVHFAHWHKPEVGDLVLAMTGGINDWSIGWYVEGLPEIGGAVIKEIGTDRYCNYGNESFIPIRNLDKLVLLEQEDYKFYCKVESAFRKLDDIKYRFGGLDIEGDTATIWVRDRFSSIRNTFPFSIAMRWDKKTTIKSIIQEMRNQGFGSKEFEKKV